MQPYSDIDIIKVISQYINQFYVIIQWGQTLYLTHLLHVQQYAKRPNEPFWCFKLVNIVWSQRFRDLWQYFASTGPHHNTDSFVCFASICHRCSEFPTTELHENEYFSSEYHKIVWWHKKADMTYHAKGQKLLAVSIDRIQKCNA